MNFRRLCTNMKENFVFAVIVLLFFAVHSAPAALAAEEQGTVKWFDSRKGYGFNARAGVEYVAPNEPLRLTIESEVPIRALEIHVDEQPQRIRQIDDRSWSAEFPDGLSEGEHEVRLELTWVDGTREVQVYMPEAILPAVFTPQAFAPTLP
jgi:hypothetical protein